MAKVKSEKRIVKSEFASGGQLPKLFKFHFSHITLLFILAITFIVYLPSLHNSFAWDDDVYILHNSLIHSINLKVLFSNYVVGNYHPFTMLILAIEYHFFGFNATAYHIVNILLHLVNVMLVFWL